jgi:hypothetical protein
VFFPYNKQINIIFTSGIRRFLDFVHHPVF